MSALRPVKIWNRKGKRCNEPQAQGEAAGIPDGGAAHHAHRAGAERGAGADGRGHGGDVYGRRGAAGVWHGAVSARRGNGDDAAGRRHRRADGAGEENPADCRHRVCDGRHHHHRRAGFAGACSAGALYPEQGADLFRRGGRGRVSGAGGRAHFEAHQPVEAAGGALRPAGGGVHLRARAFSGRGV